MPASVPPAADAILVRRNDPWQAPSRAQDTFTGKKLDALLGAVNARYRSGKRNLAPLLPLADDGPRLRPRHRPAPSTSGIVSV